MMSATVIGDEALAAKFTAAAAALQARQPYWIADVGEMVKESIEEVIDMEGLYGVKEDTPAHVHLASTGRVFYQTKNGISVGFGKDHPAAWALELGSQPHAIVAYDAPMLAFQWPAGDWFYGSAVWHPGNKPYKFVNRGAANASLPILMFFWDELRTLFGGAL